MRSTRKKDAGFTIVELLVVIVVIGILAGVVILAFGSWRHHTAESVVESDMLQASTGLSAYVNSNDVYPPNLANLNFVPSQGVALTLYTNAPSIGVYSNLSADLNAQLFLNNCNANLNGLDNTVCTYQGSGVGAKVHVKGTNTTNTVWPSPINPSDVTLPYGPEYTAATNAIVSEFQAQGGVFPVLVSGTNVALPNPTLQPNGPASDYCLEGRSGDFPAIVYHATPQGTSPTIGPCPPNPNLHYYK